MGRFIGNVGIEEYQLDGAMARLERLQQLQTRIQNAPTKQYAIFNSPATRTGLEEVGVDYEQLALESISIGMGAAIAAAIAAVVAIIVKVGSLIFGGSGGGSGGGGGGGGGGSSGGSSSTEATPSPTQVKTIVKAVPVKQLPKITKVVAEETAEIAKVVEDTFITHKFNFNESHPIDSGDPMIWVEPYGHSGLSLAKTKGSGVRPVALSYYVINSLMYDRRRGSLIWTINALTECTRYGLTKLTSACSNTLLESVPTFIEYTGAVRKYIDGNMTVSEVERVSEKTNVSITDVRNGATQLKDALSATIAAAEENNSPLKELSMHHLMRGIAQTAASVEDCAEDIAQTDDVVEFLSNGNKVLEELQEVLKNSQLENGQQIVRNLGNISSVIGLSFSTMREVVAETTKWQADVGKELPKMLIDMFEAAKSSHGIDEENENKRKGFIAEHKDEYEKAIAQIEEIKAKAAAELAEFNASLKDHSLVLRMLGIKPK